MEDKSDVIYDKNVQIKLLILFVMSRLTEPISMEMLTELTLCDDRISYFDVTQCISGLVETQNINQVNNTYALTAKGVRNSEVADVDLPHSVKLKAEKAAATINETLRQDALIKTQYNESDKGGGILKVSLSDGISDILAIEIYTASREQADALDKGFRRNSHTIYHEVIELISK